jgi:hypothetical protein
MGTILSITKPIDNVPRIFAAATGPAVERAGVVS